MEGVYVSPYLCLGYVRMSQHSDSHHSAEKTSRSRRAFLATAGATTVVGLAGCSGGSGNDSTTSTTTGTTTSTDSPPTKPNSLTVRAWGGSWQQSLRTNVAKPFTEDTGIEITYDNTTEEQMQGKIRTALRQGRAPPVNVNWSIAPSSYRSYQMGLMTNLDPAIVTNLDQLLAAGKPSTDTDWPFANLYSYTFALTYNTDEVSTAPESWNVWWEDQWDNDIGLYPGGDGMTPLLAKMTDTELGSASDMPKVWEKYRALKPNVGTIGDDSQLIQNLRSGEIAMAVMLPANIVNAKDDGASVDYTIPKEGARASRDTMWIPKGQTDAQTYWGQKFINYAVSKENIGAWCRNLGVAPLNPNASVPTWMEESIAFPTSEEQFNQMITVPPELTVKYGSEWSSRFNQIMGT